MCKYPYISTPYHLKPFFNIVGCPQIVKESELDPRLSLDRLSFDGEQDPVAWGKVSTLTIRGTLSVYVFGDTAPQRGELNLGFSARTEYLLWEL